MSVINSIPLIAAGDDGYQISRSVRLRSSASAYFNRTPASAGNRKTWTWSAWLKIGAMPASDIRWFSNADLISSDFAFIYQNGGTFRFYSYVASIQADLITSAVFRDPSSWYHFVVSVDTTQATSSSRIRIYVNGVQITAFSTTTYPTQNTDLYCNTATNHNIGRYQGNSQYFDGYLTEINFIDGQALTPSSFGENDAVTGVWKPKKYVGTYGTNGFYLPFTNNSAALTGNSFTYSEDFGNAAWTKYQSTVTTDATTAPNGTTTADKLIESATTGDHQVSRTFSATDNTAYALSVYAKQGERSNFRMYLQNKAGTYNYADFDLSTGAIGTQSGVTSAMTAVGNGWYRCSISCNVGTGATASPFAILSYSTGGAGSGTNGLYIWGAQFETASSVGPYYTTGSSTVSTYAIGADQSIGAGGYNSWIANNISVTAGATYDSMLDTPTPYADGGNGRGNYAVLNPLDFGANGIKSVITEGNLKGFDAGSASFNSTSVSTIGVTSGKFYCEFTSITAFVQAGILYGLPTSDITSAGIRYYGSNGIIYKDNVSQGTFSTYTTNDVIGLALDADAKTIAFYKNNTLVTTITYTSTNPVYFGALYPNTNNGGIYANFGQRPFAYTPPTGFLALNTQNLPDATIKAGNKNFDATTYTGNGSTQSITNSGSFQPDFVWVKSRSTTDAHWLVNSVTGASQGLISNNTAAEQNISLVTAFNSNGFGVNNPSNGTTNGNGYSLVGWQWKAGGTAVSNTAGSITSQVSANTTAGFSVVTYTGTGANATVGHGLGVAPKMIIAKHRNAVDNWIVQHSSLGGSPNYLWLNLTSSVGVSSAVWNTFPTSTVFGVGTDNLTNTSGGTYVAYCFSEVAGYSKFGSYTGNGSADGPFVFCGFRPKFVMIKNSSTVTDWWMMDTSRDPANVVNNVLGADTSGSESSLGAPWAAIDILSNGFKPRITNAGVNGSGNTLVFMAFAENPFKNSLAR